MATNDKQNEKKNQESETLIVVPDRLINFNGSFHEDNLLDEEIISNFFLKKKKPMLFLGKSGLFNIKRDIGQSHLILSEAINKPNSTFKCEITTEGRELLGIPNDIHDKVFVNVENQRLPIIAAVPDDAIILAVVKFNGKRYAGAWYSKKDNIMCYHLNPLVLNPDNSFVYKTTGSAHGSLLLNYILRFLVKA